MAAAIEIEGLGKRYRVGARRERYDTLRDALVRGAKRFVPHARTPAPEIWALRDISLTLDQGEVVGVIGRNGAGKTTLLRILSRITNPTEGRATVRGRLGALLEVGTGFHPELTGRDNVLLNGAVLGMRRREIVAKFDQIVEFAGIGQFIDTPVKRYSSGMHVRLAFSVAAHLEPDVLLVDEVLAVGDAEFQRRCLGRMEEIGQSGRTVIFVSHSMPTVVRLCDRVVLLDGGHVVADGPAEAVVAKYLSTGLGSTAVRQWSDNDPTMPGNELVRMSEVAVVDESRQVREAFDLREPVGIRLTFDVLREGPPIVPMIALSTEQGTHAFNALDPDPTWEAAQAPGRYTAIAWVPANLLNEGAYVVSAFVNTIASGRTEKHAHAVDAVSFHMSDSGEGISAKGAMMHPWGGAVSPLLSWEREAAAIARA